MNIHLKMKTAFSGISLKWSAPTLKFEKPNFMHNIRKILGATSEINETLMNGQTDNSHFIGLQL